MRMRDALESGSAFRAGEPRPGGPGDSLITEVAINKREVAVVLTPPLASLGFLSTSLAPKEEKRKLLELRIHVKYNLGAYCQPGAPVETVTHAEAGWARYPFAPNSAAESPSADSAEGHADGKGRSKKRGATVFNQC